MSEYHVPVLLHAAVDYLDIQTAGIYIDATFGGGGHSREILTRLDDNARLFGFDQDKDAEANIPEDARFTFVHANFCHIDRFMRLHGIQQVDGILADLGVSSHQFDEQSRGFSHRYNATLDMRMNTAGNITAEDIVNTYSAAQLQDILSQYGQVRNAKTLATTIVQRRIQQPIRTTGDLLDIVHSCARGNRAKYTAQVFQAIRIAVNSELDALKELLHTALKLLKINGKIVIISYHSLEDRLVKNFFKSGNFDGTHTKDDYGNISRPLKVITKKAIRPDAEEIRNNSRARSAVLRAAEKV